MNNKYQEFQQEYDQILSKIENQRQNADKIQVFIFEQRKKQIAE